MPFPLSPEEEDSLDEQLEQADRRFESAKATVSANLANTVTDFYLTYPNASPGATIAAARAYTSNMMDENQAKDFLGKIIWKETMRSLREGDAKEEKKSWWERNVSDKAKGFVRWALPALTYTGDVTQNVGGGTLAEAYGAFGTEQSGGAPSPITAAGREILTNPAAQYIFPAVEPGRKAITFKGAPITMPDWSASGVFVEATTLGQMITNPDLVGEGWFPNARIVEAQAEAARKVRGTINGQAFSIGRGLAGLVTQPGSREYQILSGLIDAGAAIKTPALPGSKTVSNIAFSTVGTKTGLRTLAGLTDTNSAYINPAKVSEFLDTRTGRGIIDRITEVKDIDEAIRLFPTADAKFWRAIVDVKDAASTRRLLDDTLGLGDITRGVGPRRIDQINISRWDDIKRNMPYFGTAKESKVARLLADVPGRHVVIEGGSDRAVAMSIKNVNNYLLQARLPKAQRIDLVNQLTDAFVLGDGSIRNVVIEIEKASRAAMRKFRVSDDLNDILHKGLSDMREVYEKDLYGYLDDVGSSADLGGTFTWIDDAGNVVTAGHPLMTAHLMSETMKHSVMLPDPRRVRRIAAQYSPIAKVVSKQGFINPGKFLSTGKGLRDATKLGELRTPLVVLDWVQGYLWKPLTLMTGGYVYRNMSDSLLRQSYAPGIQTGVFHPLELIQVAFYKKFKGDIWGTTFKGDPEDLIRSGQREMAEAVSASVRENVGDVNRHAREKVTGAWRRVRRGDGLQDYSKSVAAEMALLHTDEIARKLASGQTADEIIDWLKNTPEGRKHADRLQNMWKNKVIPDASGNKVVGSVRFLDAQRMLDENNARGYIETVRRRIDLSTGKNDLLREIVATGKYTDASGKIVDGLQLSRTGEIIGYDDSFLRQINNIVDDPNSVLRNYYKAQDTIDVYRSSSRGMAAVQTWDRIVDKFFAELYPKREAFLNRSPVFRQEYYRVIDNLADELAPGEAKVILENIRSAAKQANETFNKRFFFRYVGNENAAKKLWDKANGLTASNGKLTFEEIDAYAKGAALDTTKELFYNAAERSNFTDIMQIISPFGAAWAEVMKNWGTTLATNPEALKRGYVAVRGLRQTDLDNDGRGFFYTDPVTGEYVFNYPFGSQTVPLMTAFGFAGIGAVGFGLPGLIAGGGIGYGTGTAVQKAFDIPEVDMVAPAKTLNMGFNIVPGVGPYVQLAAGWFLKDKPQFDWAAKILTPYGSPKVGILPNPAWWQKMWSTFQDPENDRLYGDMTMQVMEVLAASGDYDLSTEADMQKLQEDSVDKARVLLLLRALGQFVGPTRPVPRLVVPLGEEQKNQTIKIGDEEIDLSKTDIHAVEMSKFFRQLQDENYDTAVEVFTDIFGDDFMLYLAGKTKATSAGLDASTEFGKWERSNQSFFKTYDEVAGFFAPIGSKFDYQVYIRQIENGVREPLSPQEMIEESQRLMGTSIYRRMIRAAGPNPTDEQKAILRRERERLYDEYPGFAKAPIDIRAFEAKLNVLYEAAFDTRMDDNQVALATREYLTARDTALEVAAQRGKTLEAGVNSDLRDILRAEGERLATVYPDFGRIWERLLLQEVDVKDND